MRVKDEFKDADSKCNKIKEDILAGKLSKRQIANKYKVDLAVVYKVANMIRDEVAAVKADKVLESAEEIKVDEQIAETKDEQEEQKNKDTKFPTKIDDDTILKIIELAEEGIPKTKIVEETGVSYSTVCSYCKQFGVFNDERGGNTNAKKRRAKQKARKKATKQTTQIPTNKGGGDFTEQQPEVKPVEQKPVEVEKPKHSLVELKKQEIIKVGLIKDRHPMPTNKYIFDRISTEDMFNYDRLEETVNNFLNTEIGFDSDENGEQIAKKSLQVFITGLPCASAALIKVCQQRHVNLTLLHFNNDKEDYIAQVIWNSFAPDDKVSELFSNNGTVSLYDCTLDEIVKDQFYSIKIVDFNSPNKADRKTDMILFSEYEKVWPYYGELMNKIMLESGKTRIALFADKCWIKNGKCTEVQRLNRVSNFGSCV